MSITASLKKHNKPEKLAANRPFAAKHLATAKKKVDDYEIVVRHEDGEWVAEGVEISTAVGSGETPAAAIQECREVMETTLLVMIEEGMPLPHAAKEEARTEQINVRVSLREKSALERMSKHRGFRGVSDFLRSVAITSALQAA